MGNVLITTLGRAQQPNPQKEGVGRYRKAKYRFENGYVSEETEFFGIALKAYLESIGIQIDKIVVLGTASSMWDAWLEVDDDLYFSKEPFAKELADAAQTEAGVSSVQLKRLSKILTEHQKTQVDCRQIPYGMKEEDQLEILQTISNCAETGDCVYMDVTHGLRHLPMLELQSAFLMRSRFETRGIYYGAFERKVGEEAVPVISLTGAMTINAWCCAMATLKETGNVAPLARLPGMETVKDALLKCQFYEQMNDVSQSKRYAREVLAHLEELPPEGLLFKEEIRRVFDWGNEQKYARRQFEQAKKAYENGDYLRSVILLMETVISAHMQGNMTNTGERMAMQEQLNKKHCDEWHCIRKLRNSFAHGGAPEGSGADRIIKMRKSEGDFREGMEPLMKWVESILPVQ